MYSITSYFKSGPIPTSPSCPLKPNGTWQKVALIASITFAVVVLALSIALFCIGFPGFAIAGFCLVGAYVVIDLLAAYAIKSAQKRKAPTPPSQEAASANIPEPLKSPLQMQPLTREEKWELEAHQAEVNRLERDPEAKKAFLRERVSDLGDTTPEQLQLKREAYYQKWKQIPPEIAAKQLHNQKVMKQNQSGRQLLEEIAQLRSFGQEIKQEINSLFDADYTPSTNTLVIENPN